jgi:hypothetical protein
MTPTPSALSAGGRAASIQPIGHHGPMDGRGESSHPGEALELATAAGFHPAGGQDEHTTREARSSFTVGGLLCRRPRGVVSPLARGPAASRWKPWRDGLVSGATGKDSRRPGTHSVSQMNTTDGRAPFSPRESFSCAGPARPIAPPPPPFRRSAGHGEPRQRSPARSGGVVGRGPRWPGSSASGAFLASAWSDEQVRPAWAGIARAPCRCGSGSGAG